MIRVKKGKELVVAYALSGGILTEGHTAISAKMQIGKRFHPTLVTYAYPMKTYEILADLAGKTPQNNTNGGKI